MGIVNSGKQFANNNVSMPVVVSSALGTLVAGVAITLAVKSNLKPLKAAAKVAKGAK